LSRAIAFVARIETRHGTQIEISQCGFDTPSAVASGYSTTVWNIIFGGFYATLAIMINRYS
jgi:hypothetical protein